MPSWLTTVRLLVVIVIHCSVSNVVESSLVDTKTVTWLVTGAWSTKEAHRYTPVRIPIVTRVSIATIPS
jgi:hypothetical protein